MAELIGLLDVGLIVGFVGLLILWLDERAQRIDLESRLKKHRTNVLLSNATDKGQLIDRGG